jgi:hypothetical protein
MIRDVPQIRGQRFFFQSFSMRSFRNFTRLFVSLSAAQMCKPQESCDQMEGRPGICKYQAGAPGAPAGWSSVDEVTLDEVTFRLVHGCPDVELEKWSS